MSAQVTFIYEAQYHKSQIRLKGLSNLCCIVKSSRVVANVPVSLWIYDLCWTLRLKWTHLAKLCTRGKIVWGIFVVAWVVHKLRKRLQVICHISNKEVTFFNHLNSLWPFKSSDIWVFCVCMRLCFAAHTPDNSFLGFVVEQHLNASDIKHIDDIKRQNQSLVYGKVDNFWKVPSFT